MTNIFDRNNDCCVEYELEEDEEGLMPPDLAERHLYQKLTKNIDSTINLLNSAKDLILQLKKK